MITTLCLPTFVGGQVVTRLWFTKHFGEQMVTSLCLPTCLGGQMVTPLCEPTCLGGQMVTPVCFTTYRQMVKPIYQASFDHVQVRPKPFFLNKTPMIFCLTG